MKKFLFVIVLLGMVLAASGCGASNPGSHKIIFATTNIMEGPMTLHAMDPDSIIPQQDIAHTGDQDPRSSLDNYPRSFQ